MSKVTVIIPSYNQAGLVRDAVESVFTQTFTDWEIVAVDDGSTDSTPAVLENLAGQEPRMRIVHQQNAGRSAARNVGIGLAQGEYLVFLDGDDWLLPNKLECQSGYLDAHPEVGVVSSDVYLCDHSGKIIQRYSLNEAPRRPSGRVLDDLLYGNLFAIHSAMSRRALVVQAGGFDDRLSTGEDWDFWVRMSALCQFRYLDKLVGMYRVHENMVTLDPTSLLRDQIAVREKIRGLSLFKCAAPLARRNFYCTYGILHMVLGDVGQGRRMFGHAIVETPRSVRPYALLVLSLLGRRGFWAIAQGKRWIARAVGRRSPSPLKHTW